MVGSSSSSLGLLLLSFCLLVVTPPPPPWLSEDWSLSISGFSEGRGSVKGVLSSSLAVNSDDSVAVVVSPSPCSSDVGLCSPLQCGDILDYDD
jgi:hypothetical protein